MGKCRVLYSKNGCELVAETDWLNERIVFTAPNRSGFSGSTLKEIEEGANSSIVAARQLISILDDLKDVVRERSPALLGYEGYISRKEQKRIKDEEDTDKLLKMTKAYIKDEEDAI